MRFRENFTEPLRVMVGVIAIIAPGSRISKGLGEVECSWSGDEDGMCTWFRGKWAPDGQLHCQNRIRIPVTDTITSTIECPYIVRLRGPRARELRLAG